MAKNLDTMPFSGNIEGYKWAISELKDNLSNQYISITASKNIAQSMFSSSSMIIAIIGVFQILNISINPEIATLYNVILLLALLLYVSLVILCIFVLTPPDVYGTTGNDWDEIYPAFIDQKEDRQIYRQLISNYISAIENNKPIITKRVLLSKITGYLFACIVIMVFVLILLPLYNP
ncbi:MAG: hypothetical protein JW908_00765 [Anaerolineales bacterium]|nr:hypothetical protein [Anaerolineales bacterium]